MSSDNIQVEDKSMPPLLIGGGEGEPMGMMVGLEGGREGTMLAVLLATLLLL